MPVKKAAIKDLRRSQGKALVNLRTKRAIKDIAKNIEKAIHADQLDKIDELAKKFQKTIDKAMKQGKMKKNTGARKKSRMAKTIKAVTKK
ncbi:MAG: 30S ribosomal protein S20 [Candidatus Komeilibacteria bacterium]